MSKIEADNYKKIPIWWLLREAKGLQGSSNITWGENGSSGRITVEYDLLGPDKYARFIYTQTDFFTKDKKDFDYKVLITETPCNYGSTRHWFICPLIKDGKQCGRRIGVLYKAGDYFACRHCYSLTYASRKINKEEPVFSAVRLELKIESLQQQIKRYTYNKKLTRKGRKLEKLYQELEETLKAFALKERGIQYGKLFTKQFKY